MIAIRIKSKKLLKELVGTDISPLVVETSMFGDEYTGDDKNLPFVGPDVYKRRFYGQITTENGILRRVK